MYTVFLLIQGKVLGFPLSEFVFSVARESPEL